MLTRRRLTALLAAVALLIGCVLGGVAATTLFPSRAETVNYSAQLRLSISASDINRIHIPTVFGDINLDFGGPWVAPGVLASVQVKESITDVLAQPNVSVRALQPGPLELTAAARTAVLELGIRYAAGALAVALLALGVVWLWRRRRPGRRSIWIAGVAWAVACAGTGVASWQTYQPERLDQFATTSILGTVQRNAGLLSDVEARAVQTAPYLKNLLALSSALQDKYSPQELQLPVAARILFVSDIHGANQYALMKTIVEEENIDAVVDAGDLINFGSVSEASASGLFNGIQSLGVPYLFVRGNHDALSATDTALLDQLARVPNVVLLQPNPQTYTVSSVNGLRIAGFNDPRWFGDDNRDNARKQVPAADAFVAAFTDEPQPDVVVSHEPAAVERVERADLRVNGHFHTGQLEGNRIGIGTFTGGGPFSHFLEGSDGEEQVGQPSAFDVATFGRSCQLTSLTRYQFRNVIEGRPAYDNVSLLNGSRIEVPPSPPAAAGGAGEEETAQQRSCSATLGTSRHTVEAP